MLLTEITGIASAIFIGGAALFTGILFRWLPVVHLFSSLKITAGLQDEKPRAGSLSPGRGFAAAGLSLWSFQALAGLLAALFIAGETVIPILLFTSVLTIPFWYLLGVSASYPLRKKAPLTQAGLFLSLLETFISGIILPFTVLFLIWNVLFPGVSAIFGAAAVLLAVSFFAGGGIGRIGFFSGQFLMPAVLSGSFALMLIFLYIQNDPETVPLLHGPDLPVWLKYTAAAGIFHALTFPGSGYITSVLSKTSVIHPVRRGLIAALLPVITAAAALAWYPFAAAALAGLRDTGITERVVYTHSAEGFILMTAFIISASAGLSLWLWSGAAAFQNLTGIRRDGFFNFLWFFSAFVYVYYLSINTSGSKALFPDAYLLLKAAGYSALFSVAAGLIPVFTAASASAAILKKQEQYFSMQKGKHSASGLIQDLTLLLMVILPKSLISRFFGYISFMHFPSFIMQPVIRAFASFYEINLSEAEKDLKDYKSLNKFFTRGLRSGVRPISQGKHDVVSPVDGRISVFGPVTEGRMIQAKNIDYSMEDLLDRPELTGFFQDGFYMVIYLSPQDYHRIHSPREGEIIGYSYIPGKLFAVNRLAVDGITGLFPKNERLTTHIRTGRGHIAVIKVGAVNVGKISLAYDRMSTNSWIRLRRTRVYEHPRPVSRGEEIGRFEMGSTVVLLFEKGIFQPKPGLTEGQKIRLGEVIGELG